LVIATSGCAWGLHEDALRTRAAFDFQCPEDKIALTKLAPGNDASIGAIMGADGCGRRATYVQEQLGSWIMNTATGKVESAPSSSPAAPSASASPPAPTNEQAAQAAAEAWLAMVDAGDYAKSWDEAAAAFKQKIDQPGWEKALTSARTPLGKLQSRTLKSAQYATSLPGAPDGEYVVLHFDASFSNKQSAVETVTPAKDAGGRWRVSGYFIR
jgi:hypothetical protein